MELRLDLLRLWSVPAAGKLVILSNLSKVLVIAATGGAPNVDAAP